MQHLYDQTFEKYHQLFQEAVIKFEETDLGTMWMIQYMNGALLPKSFSEMIWTAFVKTIPAHYNPLEFEEYNTHYVNLYKNKIKR